MIHSDLIKNLSEKMREEFKFFRMLTYDECADFIGYCENRQVEAGGTFWREGDKATSVTAVVLDSVDVVTLSSGESERLITEHPMLGLKLLKHIFIVTSKRLSGSYERIASIF